jgi:hypothetical protein
VKDVWSVDAIADGEAICTCATLIFHAENAHLLEGGKCLSFDGVRIGSEFGFENLTRVIDHKAKGDK